MMTVWTMSHLFQEARVAAFCSAVAVPKHRPWICSGVGFLVNRVTTIARTMQKRKVHTPKA